MGPVRHRLINLLSIVVVLQLAVALVTLAARGGLDFGKPGEARSAAEASDTRQPGSVLAAGKFTKGRGSKTTSQRPAQPAGPGPNTAASAAAPPAAAVTAPPAASTQPPASAGSSPVTAAPSTAATTATTARAAPSASASAAATGTGASRPATITDPAGDTTVDGDGTPLSESRADIVSTGAAHGPGGITFVMQVQRPTDPRTDERWASDSTYATWSVDTNGDAQPDFEVQYFFVDHDNLGGSVSRPGDDGETVCQASAATYSADGYKVTFDPACLNNPAQFSYKASLYYDTNPADENADVATDTAPNGGWSFPITHTG